MGLKLLKVSPLSQKTLRTFSYFSTKEAKKGALVSVPLGKKVSLAVVLATEEIKDIKTALRRSPYPLKKISQIMSPLFFSPEIIKAAQKTADYSVVGTGTILKELCPQAILEKPDLNKIAKNESTPNKEKDSALVLQASKKQRIKFYKNLIRSEFAQKKSLFICAPSAASIEQLGKNLKTGIEKFVFSFCGEFSAKTIRDKWEAALKEKHPILIIATGLFLSLPRTDLGIFIIETEGSGLYKLKYGPAIDIRIAAENIAQEKKSRLMLADDIVRTETYHKMKLGKLTPAMPTTPKITSRAEQTLVDMKKYRRAVSDELKETLESAYKKNEHTILFTNRRGYHLSTACDDCGKITTCQYCDSPLVLHKNPGNIFVCHKCLQKTEAIKQCPHCQSWKLKTLGYGIQKIAEEIKEVFPDFKIFRLDSDAVKTKKEARQIIKNFSETSGSVLIATEMLFSFFDESAERIAVVSIDGLFSLPDFRINEKIFRLLLRLKMKAKKTFLLQTRLPEHPLFENVLRGDVSGFYQSELSARKTFGYPPFKTLIKISLEGKDKSKIREELKALEKKLSAYRPTAFAAFTPKTKSLYRFCLALKLEPDSWPEQQKELYEVLSSLPPQWKIDVNPESLL